MLPRAARRLASGHFTGWVTGCELDIAGPFIAIRAPSRERAMEQAARVLRIACHQLSRVEISAVLESPEPWSGRDGWTILVNADIAFSPTALGAVFPRELDAAAAALV